VKVKWLGMPNVIANRAIVPEFIQHQATPSRIAAATKVLIEDRNKRATMQRDLAGVVGSLGGPGASERAARAIFTFLQV